MLRRASNAPLRLKDIHMFSRRSRLVFCIALIRSAPFVPQLTDIPLRIQHEQSIVPYVTYQNGSAARSPLANFFRRLLLFIRRFRSRVCNQTTTVKANTMLDNAWCGNPEFRRNNGFFRTPAARSIPGSQGEGDESAAGIGRETAVIGTGQLSS